MTTYTQPPMSLPVSGPTAEVAFTPPSDEALLRASEFVSLEQLARMCEAGVCRRVGMVLVTTRGDSFTLQEALRILGTAEAGKTDPYGLTGRVGSLASWLERGFRLTQGQAALGRHVYDIDIGVLLHPITVASGMPFERE